MVLANWKDSTDIEHKNIFRRWRHFSKATESVCIIRKSGVGTNAPRFESESSGMKNWVQGLGRSGLGCLAK